MSTPHKTTQLTKEAADAQREWYVVDLDGQILGRAATKIATVLRGKHKPTFTPHVDCGDFVIVLNAEKVKMTGNKWASKSYYRHSLHPGGLKTIGAEHMRDTHPDRIIRAAVWGMLPKNKLGRKVLKKLKIYAGSEHDHQAQKPQPLAL